MLPLLAVIGCTVPDAGAPADEDNEPGQPEVDLAREIEEADIVKEIDGFFYLVNPYKGLRIIDARSLSAPILAGGLPLSGRGVELFVRDGRAYIFTAADFLWCAGEPVGFAQAEFGGVIRPEFEGSRLWVVDVSDPQAPAILSQLDFDGFVSASRRVGDVLYAAGNRQLGSGRSQVDDTPASQPTSQSTTQPALDPNRPGVFVTSINIGDPANAVAVETEVFSGTSLDIHVSQTAMYVLGPDPDVPETTLVSYVDISDPDGRIAPRDQFRVPGLVYNRYFADEFEGTFRIVTEEFISGALSRAVRLYTYDVRNPDEIVRIAELPIVSGESLRAVRFDGARGYAVTFLQVDPLFVMDLSDPADPQLAGNLEVPGYSTHLVPLGERLVGVGFDDTNGVRPAVALYDVSDPASPSELSRIIVGEAGSFDTVSEATVDEKALKVIEDAGLILLPFSRFDSDRGEYVDALQLIELGATSLRERGRIEHPGLVRRAGLREGALWVLSDLAFQTVGGQDPDSPVSLGIVTITSEQELLDAGLSGCADSARYRGTELGFFSGGFTDFFFPFGICFPWTLFLPAFLVVGLRIATRARA
ncbi:MAG: beta-propeller domain-containing protein [Phycisphaerae bacterium]|jgi:hypothetical protein